MRFTPQWPTVDLPPTRPPRCRWPVPLACAAGRHAVASQKPSCAAAADVRARRVCGWCVRLFVCRVFVCDCLFVCLLAIVCLFACLRLFVCLSGLVRGQRWFRSLPENAFSCNGFLGCLRYPYHEYRYPYHDYRHPYHEYRHPYHEYRYPYHEYRYPRVPRVSAPSRFGTRKGLRRRRWVLEVPTHHDVAAHEDLTQSTVRHVLAGTCLPSASCLLRPLYYMQGTVGVL